MVKKILLVLRKCKMYDEMSLVWQAFGRDKIKKFNIIIILLVILIPSCSDAFEPAVKEASYKTFKIIQRRDK